MASSATPMIAGPFNSHEWAAVLFTALFADLRDVLVALHTFCAKHPTVNFAEVESALRKHANVPLFLFAEDPAVARYNRGYTPLSTSGEKKTYLLSASTKRQPREKIRQDFEKGCWDEAANLERLKQAGFASISSPPSDATDSKRPQPSPQANPATGASLDMSAMAKFLRLCLNQTPGTRMELVTAIYQDLKKAIANDPTCQDLWTQQKIYFSSGSCAVLVPPLLLSKDKVVE